MANYDEVVKRNKDYLTQAQINALAAASKEYNIANAGNRAGALASAREQYDTAYRGLQNMGLAGNPNAAPASGEVPRLQMQVKTPFDSYNERLKQVENQRLGALGEQFKQDTIAQREAEEAARRAQEEARRRAQLQAAAQTLQSKALKIGTTVMKGVANKLMGISSTKKENPAAVAAATKAQVDGLKRTQQVQQQTVNAAVKAQIDGMNRTARPQDVAAAAAFNIAHYSQQPAVTAANAAQERGMKLTEQYKGAADTSKANQYYVDANQKAFTKEQAEVEYKEAQNNLTNLQQKRHGGGAVSEDEYKAAVYQRDAAKLKAENPKLYQSFAIIENPYADAKSREEAGNEIMRAYGYTNDERTAEQYTADKKKAAQYSSYLATFDDKNASAEEKKAAENMLKNMGVTPDQAREFISKHRQARAGQGEYSYYKNAILNSLTYAGKTPSRGVNKDETDPLYRAVNKLNAEKGDDYNLMYSELAALPDDVTTGEEYVGNELRYLTEDERNAYNYIYETEGLQKANQYIRDGLPLRNVRAAIDDEAYAKQLVENSPVAANFLSIAAGTFGNVPAMIEKLVKGTYNFVAQPQTPLFIDTNDDRLANMSNLIQSATSQKILESNPGTSGKIYNFAYQTGMSMAQSAVAMTFAAAGAPWAVDVMFFSSAGNEAYKDAIERGATQEQALASGVLSGVAEALFEHASIEHFMNLDYQGKGRVIKNMLSQAGAEASEEINTELANILTDAWVMRDKSNYNLAVQQYMSEGMDKDVAENKAFMDQLGNVGMAGLGGLVSGLGFGVFGALPNAVSQVKTGKEAKASKVVDQYVRNAALLGGDAQRLAQEVNDAYGVKKTKSGSIETEKVAGREKMKTTEPSNRLVGALVQQVNKQVQELAQSAESGAAVQTLLTGEKLTTNGAKAVMDQLGADTVAEMGYDTSSPSAFAKSYNAKLQETGITPRMQETGKYRQAAYGMAERRNSPIEYKDEFHAFTAQDKANAAVTAARANASNRVWANPTQGMAMATPEGNRVMPMPGNLRAVEQAEQERTNFKARSTATKGNVTYAVAGMQAREGLSNEQTYSEIQKGLTKEARQKAQLYEKLASALGVKMVIHDVMTGTNGFIDENGNMHVVLSGKQSVLRVAAHELTHLMKENAGNEYASMRDHLISEVGQEKFDRMTKQKANEYGIDLSTEKGKILADDEVCAELCERMLSNEDALEKFAEKDTAAAKTLKEHLLKILNAIKAAFKRAENRDFGESWSDLIRQQDTIESWITGLQKAIDNANARSNTTEGQIANTAGVTSADQAELIDDIKSAKTDADIDNAISEHSVDVIEYDMAGYAQDLFKAGMTQNDITVLFDTMNKAVDMVKAHRAILDFGAELDTEEDILKAKRERAYLPYKQNADPHYKLALDFSTLCRKRVLLQTIQERLQAQMGRALTQEETVAIRLELQKLQREGYKVEVACALCYVEAARLKSPKVINTFLNNTGNEMRNYFAQKNPMSKQIIAGMQQQWKVDHGYAPDATKKEMSSADVKAFNEFSRSTREQFEGVHPGEAETIDRAVRLANNERVKIGGIEFPGRETFLSASWLTKLKSVEPDIFNAFTDKVRSATRSKAQETDTFYSRGDIDMVTESILNYANAESGFRHQSWSDFVPTHLLDTMAAVIEMSTRKAKMHAYTKVPSMVRLLGKTGMALNMSLIPAGDTGLVNGELSFDSVEGMPWETMMELRDMFPDTAGNIAIGINGEQIQKLLSSNDIDYVIPYHASGMNKNMRGYLDIRAWSEYTSSQNEKSNHRGKKGAAPALEEWFDADAAAKAEDGYAFMRAASEKYLHLCYERNLTPKFSQYLTNNGDGSYSLKEGYENYWKMLTDRKMVNQKTGKVIIQEAVKPIFDQDTALGILEDRLADPAIQDAATAADIVTDKFSGWQADRNNASAEAIQESKNIRDRTAAITAQKTAEETGLRNSDYEAAESNVRYSLADDELSRKLDEDEMVSVYRAMQVIDGKLYPPMAAKVAEEAGGKRQLVEPTEIGKWYVSEERPDLIDPKTGKWKLDKANGSAIEAAYNPYFHTSLSALNDQFSSAYKRPNLVVVEGYVPKSELTSGYKAQYAKDPVGAMRWHSGPVSSYLSTPRTVILSRYFKANRVLSNAEVARHVAKLVKGENVSIPQNTVTPGLYAELQKLGVPTTAMFSIDTDSLRQAFTVIDTEGIEDGLEALKDVKHVGSFALKDITRFLDASAGKNKDLRNTLHAIFEAPHSEATGRYARGVERMQQKVLDIGKRAGVCDEKGKHFDSKKSAAIQNIGEGFSNTYTDLKLKVKDADHVTVKAYEPGTDNLVDSEKDYTLKELRQAYGTNAADYVWSRVFDETQKAQETGGKPGWVDEKVNTRPYTIDDLQTAYPNDWQKLKGAADEFRQMYDEYIRDQNNMLATIYPIESEYADVEKLEAGIEKKQERLAQHKAAVNTQIENLQKNLEAKEKEIASKKRTDTKAYRQLVEQANKLTSKIAEVKAEIAEYEANVKNELVKMNTLKAEMQNAVQKGDYSLKRMHRLQYRSDYFHHFTEMASGIQNLKSIFTNNTDIAPAIVGKSEGTKAKTRWAGYFQQRMGGDYTADALNGMLRYGQLAEYKLAFDPLTAYLRDVNKQIRNLSSDTNRDGLIRYIDQWADNIAGKSHKLDRVVSDAGMAPRKAMQVLQWINSRVIQNTLLFNMRSALVQISNITNAKGIVKNNIDWVNGLKAWALAAKGDEAMASIMSQSNFLASRYMDGLALTDSKLKSAKQFAGWMLGALDEISAKATWWAAYQQYTRNPNAAKNQYRNYESAIDYADDITRRTHAGRGVGELAPAMTSRVINFVAPFQVEVNNTWQLLKDNVKQKNYLGLLSTGLSVFLFNAAFEAIVGSTPLGFDFIRAVVDIALGFLNDDPDDDPDAKEIAQRFAGELVGGLPFASQIVSAFGEDNAKKILGENNDATRYGNTQIGVNAVVNAAKGLKDIGAGLIEGRKVNWIDDLDDLLNLTMPMGAKQLTRTAQGLQTVSQGYGGKYDKEGNEKVQFVTDQDILHYIHAGLFGKWALTEASEYFGEKRLLPELFGKYEGKKSATGQMVDAKEYKAALETGIDGRDYFTLKSDLKAYTTQAGKRAEMMQQSFTPEQKAKLDALMLGGKDAEMKAEGAVVYQKSSDGEWKVKADYSNQDMFDLSTNGDKIYTGTIDAMEKTGLPQDQAALAANMWEQAKAADDSKQAFRDLLRDNKNLTVEQKEALDKQYCGNKYAADYSDPDLYELSTTNRTLYDKAKAAKSKGIPVKQYVSLNEKKNAYTGEDKADYLRREVMNTNLTAKQKEALDDILISDKDRYIDYSSKAWFEISMLGKGQYTEAKEGTKVGLKPETYLTVYTKWKTLNAKNENGKTVNGLKKKRAKEYLDSLTLSGPEYSFIWTVMFGY